MANGVDEQNVAALKAFGPYESLEDAPADGEIHPPALTATESATVTDAAAVTSAATTPSVIDTDDAEFAAQVSEQIQNAARRPKKGMPVSGPSSQPEQRNCPACGKPNPPDWAVCGWCARLLGPRPAPIPEPDNRPTPAIHPPQPAQENKKWPITMGAAGVVLLLILVIAYGVWPEYDYSAPETRLREAQKAFKQAGTVDTLQRLTGFADAILATDPPDTERGRSLRDEAMKLREQVDQAQKDLALLTAALDASKTATTEDQRNAVLALLAQFVAVKSDIPLLIESQNDARDLIAVMSRSAEVSSAADVSGSVVVPPPPSAEEIYKQANDVLDKATTTQELDYLIARCQSLLKQSNLDRSLRIQTQDLLERAIASRKVLEKYSGREQ